MKYIILFLFFISFYSHCNDDFYKGEDFVFCAKIDGITFSDIFPELSYKGNSTYIILTRDLSDVDMSPDLERGTANGHLYVKSDKIYSFDSLFVMTAKNLDITDTVIFIGKQNKEFNGFFYSNKHGSFDDLRYINNAGDVKHIEVFEHKNNPCISEFPLDMLKKINAQ